jgi:GTP:adenosylcobinamide-phosphate guanylyltransferase
VHDVFDVVATTWLDEPALRAADPKLQSVLNVNTPADLERARELEGEGQG